MFNYSHPMMANCRLLWVPGISHVRNLINGDEPTVTTVGGFGAGTVRQAAKMDAVSDRHIRFKNSQATGLGGPDITVILRANWYGTGGQVVFAIRNASSTSAGFLVIFGDNGSTQDGFSAAVFGDSTFFQVTSLTGGVGAAAVKNISRTYAVTYKSAISELALWIDGRMVYSNIDAGHPWDIDANRDIFIGKQETGSNLIADLEWVAAFDRALNDEEIGMWMRDRDWPFDQLEDMPTIPGIQTVTYSTSIGVGQTPTLYGDRVTYTTDVEALAYVSGDIEGGGETPATVATYQTSIAVNHAVASSIPELVFYATIVSANASASLTAPVRYETVVGVRDRLTITIDSRSDIINSVRYRR